MKIMNIKKVSRNTKPSSIGNSPIGTNNDDDRLVDDFGCYALWREIRPCPRDTSPF